MKSLFRWCHEEGHIPLNPAAKIKEPKAGKRIPKFLSEREIELLREACLSTMEKKLFEFMFSTGCRIGAGHFCNGATATQDEYCTDEVLH
jgi:integrase/recombinase XerD